MASMGGGAASLAPARFPTCSEQGFASFLILKDDACSLFYFQFGTSRISTPLLLWCKILLGSQLDGSRREESEMCGYLCTGCGRCKGKMKGMKPYGTCIICGFENPTGVSVCARCGTPIVAPPGSTGSSESDAAVIGAVGKKSADVRL